MECFRGQKIFYDRAGKIMKRYLIRNLRKWRRNTIEKGLSIFFSVLILSVFFLFFLKSNFLFEELKENVIQEIFITALSIIAVAILAMAARKCIQHIMRKIEDLIKLNPDYEELLSQYESSRKKFFSIKEGEDKYIFPEEIVLTKKKDEPFKLELEDTPGKYYKLPDILEHHFEENILAHSESRIYNNYLIRVDGCEKMETKIKLYTSRTTFFDSLATNRAMDYIWKDGLSIRKILTMGKRIQPLEEMPLSNHLGINVIIKTKDDYILCILRGEEASISKNKYSVSCGAALVVDDCRAIPEKFTLEKLDEKILYLIEKEVNIKPKEYAFDREENILAFYRDWVEGGKPQLLVHIDVNLKCKEIVERFKNSSKNSVNSINKKIEFVSWEQLKVAKVWNDFIEVPKIGSDRKKCMRISPPISVSIWLYREYMMNCL